MHEESVGSRDASVRHLHAVGAGEGVTSKPRHRFPVGNRFGGRRRRKQAEDPIAYVDRVVTEALERVSQREYETVRLPDGRVRRQLKPMAATTANAVANLARVKLDLVAQGEAAEALARAVAEVEELRGIVADLLAARES